MCADALSLTVFRLILYLKLIVLWKKKKNAVCVAVRVSRLGEAFTQVARWASRLEKI